MTKIMHGVVLKDFKVPSPKGRQFDVTDKISIAAIDNFIKRLPVAGRFKSTESTCIPFNILSANYNQETKQLIADIEIFDDMLTFFKFDETGALTTKFSMRSFIDSNSQEEHIIIKSIITFEINSD